MRDGVPIVASPMVKEGGDLSDQEVDVEAEIHDEVVLHNLSINYRKEREVILQDAVKWLFESNETFTGSIFTGLPDILDIHGNDSHSKSRRKEVGGEVLAEEYKEWFSRIATQMFFRLAHGQCAIFSQTDSRVVDEESGRVVSWIDKSHLLSCAAEKVGGVQLLWHKIALDTDRSSDRDGKYPKYVGQHQHRPAYTHVLCYGKHFSYKVSSFLTPDVIDRGEMTWIKATGLEVCLVGILFLRFVVNTPRLLNPFCGQGTLLAVANYLGLPATGVEVLARRYRRSQRLDLTRVLDRLPLSTFTCLGMPAEHSAQHCVAEESRTPDISTESAAAEVGVAGSRKND